MGILGIDKLRRAARRLRNITTPGGLILMYHRVAEAGSSDPWGLCVSPRHFAEHLEVLRKYGSPVRLQQLAQASWGRNRLHRAIAVTFDDGYADNLHNAKPLLERYDVPATVFLTTGYLGSQREFWWDELDRLLLQPGTLLERLQLTIDGHTHQWALGEAACYSEDACRQHCSWRAEEEAPSARHTLYCSLWQLLYPLPEGKQRKVLDELVVWAGSSPAGRPTHRSFSTAEAASLAQRGLVEIGAHTVTHPPLPLFPVVSQWEEVRQSKIRLEEILGLPVSSFSYPYGCYTMETAAIVRAAGFTYACATAVDLIRPRTDQFQLPRVYVEDWDGEEFTRRLLGWFDD